MPSHVKAGSWPAAAVRPFPLRSSFWRLVSCLFLPLHLPLSSFLKESFLVSQRNNSSYDNTNHGTQIKSLIGKFPSWLIKKHNIFIETIWDFAVVLFFEIWLHVALTSLILWNYLGFFSCCFVLWDTITCSLAWPQTCYMAEVVLEHLILLPRVPKCRDYTHKPLHLTLIV